MSTRLVQIALAAVTPREREVLHWVCEGKTDSEIGKILDISVHTVSKHLQRVFIKLGVENRTAAARFVSFAVNRPETRRADSPPASRSNGTRSASRRTGQRPQQDS